jgi:hypothetical protein
MSEDSFGKLSKTNPTIKNNLKSWLNRHRMMNDSIDILDPYIINLGIEFIVRPAANVDKYDLLERAVEGLKEKYDTPLYIGEPLFISDIYETLKKVRGVLDVVKVKIVNMDGSAYSSVLLEINENLSPDGSHLVVPKNAVVEIKYPDTDIRGKVR